uniref:metalloprotease TIKI2-like n=1 Tax=Pristiophorus japonicus TaxID=55135 RepID=UPI00398E598C
MGKRVTALLEANPDKSFFFAFGAGHFLGNNTVIDVLRQGGYEVEHTPAGQPFELTRTQKSGSSSGSSPLPSTSLTSIDASLEDSLPGPSLSSPAVDLDDDIISPHILMPDSLSQLEEFGRQKKRQKKLPKQQRQRQFSDLWVRIEESTTVMPSNIRIINGYITVEPAHEPSHQKEQHPILNSASMATVLSATALLYGVIWSLLWPS